MAVVLDLPSRMACDEPGCSAFEPAELCLLSTGSLAFRPTEARRTAAANWQVRMTQGGVGPFAVYCPLHSKKLVTTAKQMSDAMVSEH